MRKKLKRLASLISAAVLLLMLTFTVLPLPAQAAADTLTIKVGYFGLPYATKAEYSMAEVEAIGVHSTLHTMNTNGGFLSYANAEGVYLKDILNNAGVNVGSVNYINFMATDGHNASKNYYYNTLFGTRYAFPDLSRYYGQLEGVTDEDAVWESAVTVKTMLAVRDNYARVDDFSEYEPGDMTSSHRFRLMIGQTYPGEVVASDSIYEINTVIVTYAGSPQIDAESDVTISIDDDHTLVYSVSSVDSDLTRMIREGLKFKSSDPSIVEVDENGKLTAKREGEVEITIYYKAADIDAADISTTVRVKVGGGSGDGGNGTGDGLGDGTGSGSGAGGSGTGDGHGSGAVEGPAQSNGDGGGADNGSSESGKEPGNPGTDAGSQIHQKNDSASQGKSEGQVNQIVPEEAEKTQQEVYVSAQPQANQNRYTLQVRSARLAAGTSAPAPEITQGGSSGGAEGGSEALGLKLDNAMLVIAAILAALLFLSGSAGMYIKFRKEI